MTAHMARPRDATRTILDADQSAAISAPFPRGQRVAAPAATRTRPSVLATPRRTTRPRTGSWPDHDFAEEDHADRNGEEWREIRHGAGRGRPGRTSSPRLPRAAGTKPATAGERMRVGSVVGVMLDEVDVMLEETVQATADSSPRNCASTVVRTGEAMLRRSSRQSRTPEVTTPGCDYARRDG